MAKTLYTAPAFVTVPRYYPRIISPDKCDLKKVAQMSIKVAQNENFNTFTKIA